MTLIDNSKRLPASPLRCAPSRCHGLISLVNIQIRGMKHDLLHSLSLDKPSLYAFE